MNLQKFTKLQRDYEQAKSDESKSAGIMERILQELKEKHRCNSLEEAQKKLKRLQKEQAECNNRYEETLSAFEQEYGDKIGE